MIYTNLFVRKFSRAERKLIFALIAVRGQKFFTHSKMDQRKKRALKGLLILLMSFIALCIIYGYPHIFFLRPQSVHTWRQTDGASLMLNYYHDGLNFFQPRLHHQEGTNGKTVAEFPITYYLGAVACKIFGFKEGFTRVVSLLFFLLGIIGMYGIVFLYTQSLFYSICIALFLFASPVEAYYAFNFLPDSTATGAMLMGTLFLLTWHKYGQKYLLIPFVIFFGIAGMIKITALYPLLAYLATGVTLLIQNGSKLLNFCKKIKNFIYRFNVFKFLFFKKFFKGF